MISLDNVSKNYGNKKILQDVNLHIQKGVTTSFLAPSGHGKTTLLRLIMGLTPVTQGRIQVEGQNPAEFNAKTRALNFGYVMQDGGLFPHLNGKENITLGPKHLGMNPETIESQLNQLVELVHLRPEILKQYPHQLSGGQKQRLGIIRALMLDPRILIFDEPLSALDPINRRSLQLEFKKIFSCLHKTVIYVTHNIDEAIFLSDQIIFLHHGKISYSGGWDLHKLEKKEDFMAEFIASQRPLTRF